MEGMIYEARRWLRDEQTRWFLRWLGKWALLVLALILYTLIVSRVSEARASRKYENWKEEWVSTYLADQEAKTLAQRETDPYQIRLSEEATMLAKVLYGVKDNDTDDMRTLCWCVFNRTDNAAYPDTLEDVIAQPHQWMRYSPDNPVLESLYQIAREQLEAWRKNGRRPVGSEYVFMAWSEDDICLRDSFVVSSHTKYWRYGQ